jgi:hypothetical protein
MNYIEKYLKYKSKYLELKKQIDQQGGIFSDKVTYLFCNTDIPKIMASIEKDGIPNDLVKLNKGVGVAVPHYDKKFDFFMGKSGDDIKNLPPQEQKDKIISENLRMIEFMLKTKTLLDVFPPPDKYCKKKDIKNRCVETLKFQAIVVKNNTFKKNELINTIDYFDPNGPYYNAVFELYKKYNMGWTLDTPTKFGGIYVTDNNKYAMLDEEKINSENNKKNDTKIKDLEKKLADQIKKKQDYENKISPEALETAKKTLETSKKSLEDFNKKYPPGSYEEKEVDQYVGVKMESKKFKEYTKRKTDVDDAKKKIKKLTDDRSENIKKLDEAKLKITEIEKELSKLKA